MIILSPLVPRFVGCGAGQELLDLVTTEFTHALAVEVLEPAKRESLPHRYSAD